MAKVSFNKVKSGDVVLVRHITKNELLTGIVINKDIELGVGKFVNLKISFDKFPRKIYMEDWRERGVTEKYVIERIMGNIHDEDTPLLINGLDKDQYGDAFNTIKEEGGRVKPNDFGFMVLCDGKEVDDIIIVETPLGTEKIAFMSIMRAESGELMHDLNSGEYAYEEVFPRSVAEWNSILNYFNGQM